MTFHIIPCRHFQWQWTWPSRASLESLENKGWHFTSHLRFTTHLVHYNIFVFPFWLIVRDKLSFWAGLLFFLFCFLSEKTIGPYFSGFRSNNCRVNQNKYSIRPPVGQNPSSFDLMIVRWWASKLTRRTNGNVGCLCFTEAAIGPLSIAEGKFWSLCPTGQQRSTEWALKPDPVAVFYRVEWGGDEHRNERWRNTLWKLFCILKISFCNSL